MQTADTSLKILVPLDGSSLAEQAIPYAATLAGPNEEITLLHVAPPPTPARDLRGWNLPMTEQDQARYVDRLRAALAEVAERWHSVAPAVAIEVAIGDPSEEILRTAQRQGIDLIVMGSHGRGALGRWRFGSVADRVARTSPIPVMIIRPQDAPVEIGPVPLHRFIVPLDGSELAAQALPVAERLARRTHRPIHLIRVLPQTDELLLPTPGFGVPAANVEYRDITAALVQEATRMLEDEAARLESAGIPTTWQLGEGSPFAGIADAARPGDVIVLASHGRSGLTRWVLGSVAEKLIRLAEAPVIVVRATAAGTQAGEGSGATP